MATMGMKRNRRGAVMVEYALVLAFVAAPAMTGIFAAGGMMLQNYLAFRTHIVSSVP